MLENSIEKVYDNIGILLWQAGLPAGENRGRCIFTVDQVKKYGSDGVIPSGLPGGFFVYEAEGDDPLVRITYPGVVSDIDGVKYDLVLEVRKHVDELYAEGRNTVMGDEELEVMVRRASVDRYERLLFHRK